VGAREIHFIHTNSWFKSYQDKLKFMGITLINHGLPPASQTVELSGLEFDVSYTNTLLANPNATE
jgi:hypothetical protein